MARVPDPPAWNPDAANAMPYSTWTQRLMVWGILAVDLDPSQQCAAIVERLGGSARELADALSWQELTTGGVIGGQAMDPVTFLLTPLAAHYAPFGGRTTCERHGGTDELPSTTTGKNRRLNGPLPYTPVEGCPRRRWNVDELGRLQLVTSPSLRSQSPTVDPAFAALPGKVSKHSARV